MNPIKAAKVGMQKAAGALGYEVRRKDAPLPPHRLELDPAYADTIAAVGDYTMTPVEKIAALVDATRYIVRENIPGAFVECGVWRGGSMMAAARTLLEMCEVRDLFLFDTYAGMTQPGEDDIDLNGRPAEDRFLASAAADHNAWCYASLEDVRRNLFSTGYPQERCHFIKGDVLQTLPHAPITEVAMLRLDTDWYESTLHELNTLYPRISSRGVLIIDDYGHWKGCQKAVDNYFAGGGPFLAAIDATGKIAVKTEAPRP